MIVTYLALLVFAACAFVMAIALLVRQIATRPRYRRAAR